MSTTDNTREMADPDAPDWTPSTTRAEHLQWCKDRALAYADRGDDNNALASLISDLGKHPETAPSQPVVAELGVMLAMTGHMTGRDLVNFINGVN